MDSNHPRRLYESRVLPTELASLVFPRKLAGRAGLEPAHGVSNSHVPFQLGYRPKTRRPRFLVGAFGNSICTSKSGDGSDQSRGPSAIDAPSHHGFNLYRHFEDHYTIAFGGNPLLTGLL